MLIADISSCVMNVNLCLVTKSKSHKKVAKMRYQTFIYMTIAEIAFLHPFFPVCYQLPLVDDHDTSACAVNIEEFF